MTNLDDSADWPFTLTLDSRMRRHSLEKINAFCVEMTELELGRQIRDYPRSEARL